MALASLRRLISCLILAIVGTGISNTAHIVSNAHNTTNTGKTNATTNSGYFWHISDIHWDVKYSVLGDSIRMCHQFPNQAPQQNGIYGHFNCDAPWKLVNSSIHAMHQLQPNPDFIIWTGDNAPHLDHPHPSWDDIFYVLKNVSLMLNRHFPSIPILPIIGNHDTDPPGVLPPNETTIYDQFLLDGGWDILLPTPSSKQTFRRGGYYNVFVRPGLQVVGLNTIIWWKENGLVANESDPSGQFAWLEGVLEDAQRNGTKVYLIGHIPPGFHPRMRPGHEDVVYYSKFNRRYIELINRYRDIIMGQFFGHQHYDTFMLFRDERGEVSNSILLGPAVTPWHNIHLTDNSSVPVNPGIRLFIYDRSNATLLNYHGYFLNLSKANEEANELPERSNNSLNTIWEHLYSFIDTYKLPDVSTPSLARLYDRLVNDTTAFRKYIYLTTSAKNWGQCSVPSCRASHLCTIGYVSEEDHSRCLQEERQKNHLNSTQAS